MIPIGPWHPDARAPNAPILLEAVNCTPAANGFSPIGSPAAVSDALPSLCYGSGSFLRDTGNGFTTAGTSTDLYHLGTDSAWAEVSKSTAAYTTASGDR